MNKIVKFLKKPATYALPISMAMFGTSAFAVGTAYDGITTAVTQPLTDALTVIVAIAGLMAVLYVGWKVSKMLLTFVRGA